MLITRTAAYRLSIPMVPFTIATGTMSFAQNVFIKIDTNTGLTGVGECSAFPMIAGETQETCMVLAKNFAQIWKGKIASDIDDRMKELDQFIAGNHTIKSAFDMALYDLAAKAAGLPLYRYLGGSYFEPESDLTIGIGSPVKMAEQAIDFVSNKKATILKIKLGKSPEDDVQRVMAVRGAIGSAISIRIDANQGWDFNSAVYVLNHLEKLNIEFCEQPMPKYLDDQLYFLKQRTSIPIMADESVFDHRDALRLIKNKVL